jgi:hypothetical protein
LRTTADFIMNAMRGVLESAVSYGDGSMVDSDKLTELRRVLNLAEEYNTKAVDIKRLTKDALECQNACNPRPISLLLHHAIGAVMENGGNPAFVESPLVRLYMNTMLNMMGYRSLPHYDEDVMLYHRDVEALEASLKEGE